MRQSTSEGLRGLAPWALVAVVALTGLLAFSPPNLGLRGAAPGGLLRDFDAFYCAGESLGRGADPYREEPLGACEGRAKPAPFIGGTPGLVTPAPLPPYALAPFVLLAHLPFAFAGAVWILVLAGCLGATIFAVRRLTGLPLLAVTAAFVLGDGYAAFSLGQVAPLAVAAAALAALLLERERDEAAGGVAALAMIEPHVGLPACLGLALLRPRTRLPLAAAALAAIALSLAVAGSQVTLEYFRDVVPAHALSEIANEKQLSLTYALHRLGVPALPALRAGELWYAAMSLLGIACAGVAVRRGGSAALVALLPPAFAVVGGPFVHVVQIAAALPAALLLRARISGAGGRALGVAIALLAVPWIQFANLGSLFPALAAAICAILTWTLVTRRPLVAGAAAVAAIVFLGATTAAIQTNIGDASPTLLAQFDPRALAERSWALYVATIGAVNAPTFDVTKLPTIAGLLTVVLCALAAARSAKSRGTVPTIASSGNGAEASRRIAMR